MTPYTVNFKKVRRNIDWYQVLNLKNGAGAALDISGATFFLDVKPKVGDAPAAILSLSLGSGLSFGSDGSDGVLIILVDSEVMKLKPLGSYKYDLVIVRGGVSEVFMEGSLKIVEGVTDL